MVYNNPIYQTHIRLDVTWRSVVPHIRALVSSVASNTDFLSIQTSADLVQFAENLLSGWVKGQTCQPCLPSDNNRGKVNLLYKNR